MKILLLGSTGMLGSCLKKILYLRGYSVIGVARSNSDKNTDLSNQNEVLSLLNNSDFDAIINCAALVDINECERDPKKSWLINAKLVSLIVNWNYHKNKPFLHISTDHFFNYGDNIPHKEHDNVVCVNEYARHKFAAESFALTSDNSLVLRTSLLSVKSDRGNSLIEWAMNKINHDEVLRLFNDAWTSSIEVNLFAELAFQAFFDKSCKGLYNLAAREVFSKETLIKNIADKLALSDISFISESIKDKNNLRANCLGLDVTKIEKALGKKMPCLDQITNSLIKQMS